MGDLCPKLAEQAGFFIWGIMEIKTLKVIKINPAVYNPRKDLKPGDTEYEKLKKSILEFDMVEPLVWNKRTGNLVGGHQRLKILKELNIENVEVSVVDLSEVKEKALNLALNKIQGEWDFPRLKDLLEELDTGDFDIEITGFDPKEIEDLMTQFHVPGEGLTDDDEIPEKVETVCKTGNLWQLGNHRLLCGDATKKEDVERLMGGEKADAIITDPPYGINLDTSYSGMPSRWNDKKYLHKFESSIKGDDKPFDATSIFALFKCKEIFLFGADYYTYSLPNYGKDGGWFVWDKREEENYDRMLGSCFELIWAKQKHKREIIRMRWAGIFNSPNTQGEPAINRLHPTQKPVALNQWFIDKFSKIDNIIIDLFGGSGSTLIACEKLGRRCYMMEIDPHYCDVIIQRWQNFTGKEAVRIDGQ